MYYSIFICILNLNIGFVAMDIFCGVCGDPEKGTLGCEKQQTTHLSESSHTGFVGLA